MAVMLTDCPVTVESVTRRLLTMPSVSDRVADSSGALLIPDVART